MAQLRDIYLFVRKVNKLSREEETDENIMVTDAIYRIGEPTVAKVRNEYTKRRFIPDRSRRKVQLIGMG